MTDLKWTRWDLWDIAKGYSAARGPYRISAWRTNITNKCFWGVFELSTAWWLIAEARTMREAKAAAVAQLEKTEREGKS